MQGIDRFKIVGGLSFMGPLASFSFNQRGAKKQNKDPSFTI
jgi:hypothetical protein